MSVLIKDMKMPTRCIACQLNYDSVACILTGSRFYKCNTEFDPSEERLSDCPLIPIPPYSDLIERKAAYDSILKGMVMTGYQSRALDCISDFYVPTIIPAEEGET